MGADREPESLTPLQQAFYLLQQSQQKLAAYECARTEPIAVVGTACRFPGHTNSLEDFWQLLVEGRDAISEVPPDRWDIDEYFDPDPATPDRMNTRWGGFLEAVDQFDADFFGISPREAIRIDPQQRLLLEVTWEALEDAGLPADQIAETRTGIYVGAIGSDYALHGLQNTHDMDIFTGTGISHSIMANRLSYVLNTSGPSISIDTACSSSLVTIHMACQSLRLGESDMALAGGVNLILDPAMTLALTKAHMMAPDGRCKAFAAAADGYVRSEGCGMVVLKRLSDATAAGDRILAVLRGTAVNHDGRSNGMSAPNGPAQQSVIRTALADAGLQPADISYVEAHGTGTRLGDPIEIDALRAVLCEGRADNHPLRVGSVKTNIGHLESAAGIAGLMKVILMLRHGQIPPHLHLDSINPLLNLAGSAVEIPKALSAWHRNGEPRRAGVSAFGFGGTNSHVIVEEPPAPAGGKPESERSRHIVTLSARTPAALTAIAARYAAAVAGAPEDSLADIAYTANCGRTPFEHRAAIVTDSVASLGDELRRLASEPDAFRGSRGAARTDRSPRIAFLFTGQGAQYAGMAQTLYQTQPSFRADIDRCSAFLESYLDRPLTSLLEPDAGELLNQTGFTQPALFAIEYALANLWRSWGIAPTVVMGHSVGEFAAACIAGVLPLEDGLRLIAERARMMQSLPHGGLMAAVFGNAAQVSAAIETCGQQVAIAAFNGPENIVISGDEQDVLNVLAELKQSGIKSKPLATSHAFHSHRMDPVLHELEQVAASIDYAAPQIDVISNLTGQVADETTFADPTYWSRHARSPVRFAESLQTAADLGCDVFLELGPSPVLIGMGQRCLDSPELTWLPSLRSGRDDWQTMLESLSRLYVAGARVDWNAFDNDYSRRKVSLPTYPFQRKRYWYEEPLQRRPAGPQTGHDLGHPLLGEHLATATAEEVFVSRLTAQRPAFLAESQMQGESVMPLAGLIEMVLSASAELHDTPWNVREFEQVSPLLLDSTPRTVQTVISPGEAGRATFNIFELVQENAEESPRFVAIAKGRLEESSATATTSVDLTDLNRRFDGPPVDEQSQLEMLETSGAADTTADSWSQNVRLNANQALVECKSFDRHEYQLHPGLLNSLFRQISCILGSTANRLPEHTPTGVDRVELHDPTLQPKWSLVTLHAETEGAAIGDIQLFDATGQNIAEFESVRLQSVPRDWVARQKHRTVPNWCYELAWSPQPFGDIPTEAARATPDRWLIFDDRKGLGPALSERLEIKGESCTTIPANVDSDRRRAAIHEFLAQPAAGRCNVVYLSGLDVTANSDGPDLESARADGWGGILDVVHELGKSSGNDSARLWIVTRGAQPVGSHQLNLAQAPAWGLARVIAAEYPDLECTRIDLDPKVRDDDADQLAEEIRWRDREDQVAYRDGQRHVARLRLLQEAASPANGRQRVASPLNKLDRTDRDLRLGSEGTYLITGGLGGLGLLVANWLVNRGARHLVLLGRSKPAPEAVEQLQELERFGANVVVRQCDVGCGQELDILLQNIRKNLPPLRGLFHLAGVLDDGVLREQTRERFDRVMGAKVRGAWYLHELTQKDPLDLFVMFSSAASLLGSPGQGNYAAANAFLDALTHHRRAENRPALSVNWGAWDEAGMAARLAEGDKRRSSANGMDQINPTLGLRTLEQLIADNRIQAGVLPVDWPEFLQRIPVGSEPSWLLDIARESRAAIETDESGPTLVDELQDVTPAERIELATTHILRQVARVLAIGDGDLPDARRSWSELGFDSLTGVEFANRLGRSIGHQFNPTLLAEQTTPESLADYLIHEVFQFAPSVDAPADETAADAQTNDSSERDSIEAAAEIEGMSAEDIDLLVMQQLQKLDQ